MVFLLLNISKQFSTYSCVDSTEPFVSKRVIPWPCMFNLFICIVQQNVVVTTQECVQRRSKAVFYDFGFVVMKFLEFHQNRSYFGEQFQENRQEKDFCVVESCILTSLKTRAAQSHLKPFIQNLTMNCETFSFFKGISSCFASTH